MTVTFTDLNTPPRDNIGGVGASPYYKWASRRITLTNNAGKVFYTPYMVNWRPITITIDDPTAVTVEISASPTDVLVGAVAGESAQWKTVTAAANMNINYPVTAIRFGNNNSGGTRRIDVCL